MKLIAGILLIAGMAACNNKGASSNTNDSTNINIKTSSPADGGPNNGLSDTTIYHNRDTVSRDSGVKK